MSRHAEEAAGMHGDAARDLHQAERDRQTAMHAPTPGLTVTMRDLAAHPRAARLAASLWPWLNRLPGFDRPPKPQPDDAPLIIEMQDAGLFQEFEAAVIGSGFVIKATPFLRPWCLTAMATHDDRNRAACKPTRRDSIPPTNPDQSTTENT